jgi:hypothetical protein
MGFEWVPVGERAESTAAQTRTVLSESAVLDDLVLAARLEVPGEAVRARDHGRHARDGRAPVRGGHRRQRESDAWRRYLHLR